MTYNPYANCGPKCAEPVPCPARWTLDEDQFLYLQRILGEALGGDVTVVRDLQAVYEADRMPPTIPTAADPRLIKRTKVSRFAQWR